MTKSTITRERLEKIKSWRETYGAESNVMLPTEEAEELARIALAAMDSEPVAVTDDMAYAFHHALTDSMIGADDVEEIKTGLRAVFANLTAPVVSAEYPDRLPCSVLLEPGLRFGKGIKTSTMLAALARRAVHESDMAALSPEERVEFQARIEDFKALIAQPAPVVPEEITIETATIIAYGLPTTNIGAIFKAGHDACRAAMLQAYPVCTCPSGDGSLRWPCPVHPGNSPAQSDCCPAQNGVNPEQKSLTPAQDGNHLVIPDGYVMVPKEPTEAMMLHNSGCQHHAWDDPDCAMRQTRRLIWSHMLAAAPQEVK